MDQPETRPQHNARHRAATVSDVARLAGVAKATAARALGNYGAVSPTVLQRVLAAAQALDYRPNELARSMTTGRSNTLGVVVGDIENPYFSLAVRGITDAARRRGYHILLSNTSENVEFERDAVRVMLDRQVDGLIVAPASATDIGHLRTVYDLGRPLVLLDRRLPAIEVATVSVDNVEAAGQATRHLLAAGHRRIAFLSATLVDGSAAPGSDPEGGSDPAASSDARAGGADASAGGADARAGGADASAGGADARAGGADASADDRSVGISTVTDRIDGFCQAMAEAGVRDARSLIRLGAAGDGADRITRTLMAGPDRPTALFTSDSLVALRVVRTLRSLGLSIPQDVSLITFDDSDWTSITTPPVTVVSQPIYDIGVEAADMLIRRIDGESDGQAQRVFPATLIERESVGAPPTPPQPAARRRP